MPEEKKAEQQPSDVQVEGTAAPTPANTGGQQANPQLSPEEVNRVFEGGEVRLDGQGRPIPQGANAPAPQEGATLRKRHAWYKKNKDK